MKYLAFCLLLLAFLLLFILYYVYRRTFYMPKRRLDDLYDMSHISADERVKSDMRAMIDELAAYPYEEVFILSHDKKRLFGRYYHVADGAPVEIQCHGYRGAALRDFCGGAKLARALGHNILLIDQRGSGKSEGVSTSFGILERHDVLGWANYVADRFPDSEIYLVGISMGAATVLMCRELPLPKNVVGLIADCPYDTPENIIRKVVSGLGFPTEATMRMERAAARVFGGFSLRAASPLSAVSKGGVPVLLLHGEDDTFVPCSMSRNIAEAAVGELTLLTFPGADHGLSFTSDPERYRAAIVDFIRSTARGARKEDHA